MKISIFAGFFKDMQLLIIRPAYNVQAAVDAEFIVGIDVFSDRNDTATLIPMLQYLKENLPFTYRHIVADSGYESEENYVYLKKQKQTGYTKLQNHERKKKASFKKGYQTSGKHGLRQKYRYPTPVPMIGSYKSLETIHELHRQATNLK
ncbi:transposase [Oceanobacillus sp. M60]|uniref:transposase n=1 Tax=Oceanobacillus sp. FSL K6-0251 TaxID=2921602 RepID=UPI0030F53E35